MCLPGKLQEHEPSFSSLCNALRASVASRAGLRAFPFCAASAGCASLGRRRHLALWDICLVGRIQGRVCAIGILSFWVRGLVMSCDLARQPVSQARMSILHEKRRRILPSFQGMQWFLTKLFARSLLTSTIRPHLVPARRGTLFGSGSFCREMLFSGQAVRILQNHQVNSGLAMTQERATLKRFGLINCGI